MALRYNLIPKHWVRRAFPGFSDGKSPNWKVIFAQKWPATLIMRGRLVSAAGINQARLFIPFWSTDTGWFRCNIIYGLNCTHRNRTCCPLSSISQTARFCRSPMSYLVHRLYKKMDNMRAPHWCKKLLDRPIVAGCGIGHKMPFLHNKRWAMSRNKNQNTLQINYYFLNIFSGGAIKQIAHKSMNIQKPPFSPLFKGRNPRIHFWINLVFFS